MAMHRSAVDPLDATHETEVSVTMSEFPLTPLTGTFVSDHLLPFQLSARALEDNEEDEAADWPTATHLSEEAQEMLSSQ
jgi:hypothetical protein